MVDLDGVQYTVKKPSENTEDMRTKINDYCASNNILNSKGELVYIESNMASPVYLILWALGYLVTVIQNLILSVGKGFNVQSANDAQLLNLADIAGIKRGAASLTTFSARVVCATPDDYDPRASLDSHPEWLCTITSEDTVSYAGVTYAPALYPSITLAPGEIGYLTFVATTTGSYVISENSITGFDEAIDNLDEFYQYESSPGQTEESISSLRQRVQRRQYSGTSIDACIDDIRGLEGVTLCNIFYNTNVEGDMQIGDDGIILPPRWALILVQGYNANIARAFFNHLTCPTIGYDPTTEEVDYSNLNGHPERILAVQWYTTHAQQRIPVLICRPKQKQVYIKVHLHTTVVESVETAMKNAVANIAVGLTAGQSITSAMILNALKDFSAYALAGAMVSSDNVTYAYATVQAPDVLWVLNVNYIYIEMTE